MVVSPNPRPRSRAAPPRDLRRTRLRAAAPVLAATCILVAGCGGGGGGGDTPAPAPCGVATVDGCVSPEAYTAAVAGAAEEIRSTPEFAVADGESRWSLRAVNVPEAWAHLEVARGEERPGSGVTVGVVDSGIDVDHPVFTEAAAAGEVTEEFLLDARDETGAEVSHGTAVASIIAGRVNPAGTVPYTGVAPYATLKVFAIPLGDPPPPNQPIDAVTRSGLAATDRDYAPLYREVASRDLDVVNLSIGLPGSIENYDEPTLRDALGGMIEALAQADREDKAILVWAAGNHHERLCRPGSTDNCVGDTERDDLGRPAGLLNSSSPDLYAGLVARIEELRGHSIAVVAIEEGVEIGQDGQDGQEAGTGEPGEIASYSSRCGIAADWCIAAPGSDVLVAYFGPIPGHGVVRDHGRGDGTSFAAPMVTGGLALMKQMFRDQLRHEELVTRLFRTADKTGRYADRSVYGQGLLDLDAALSPVGVPGFTAGATVAGGGTPVAQSRLSLGRAFGAGSASGLAGREIAAFDALGAPFWYDLGSLVALPEPPSAGARLREFIAAPSIDPHEAGSDAGAVSTGPRLGFLHASGDAGAGHAGLAPNALTLAFGRPGGVVATAFTSEGDDHRDARPASGALVSWRAPEAPLGLRAGWLGERHSMLAATAEGAFGDLGADSFFVGLDLHHRAGGWRFSGGPEIGLARPHARGGFIAEVKPLATSAFALHATRPTAGSGVLQVSLAQPLRVEGGDAVLSVPVGRTLDHEVVRERLSADLTPAGRQLDLSVRWERPLAGGALRLGTVATRHAGHDAGSPAAALLPRRVARGVLIRQGAGRAGTGAGTRAGTGRPARSPVVRREAVATFADAWSSFPPTPTGTAGTVPGTRAVVQCGPVG